MKIVDFNEKEILSSLRSNLFDLLINHDQTKKEILAETLIEELKEVLKVRDVSFLDQNIFSKSLTDESENEDLLEGQLVNTKLGNSIPTALYIPIKSKEEKHGYIYIQGISTDFSKTFKLKLSEVCSYFFQSFEKNILLKERRYEKLFNVTMKFHSSMDMNEVLEEVIITLQGLFPFYEYHLYLSQDQINHEYLPIKELRFDRIENEYAMQAFVAGEAQVDSLDERVSSLYSPFKGKQGIYGVLQVISLKTNSITTEDTKFIEQLTNTAGIAIENAKLYQQSKKLISDLQLINEVSHKLNSNLRLTDTMNFMSEQILASFKADEVGFILFTLEDKIEILSGSTDFFQTREARPFIKKINNIIVDKHDSLFLGDLSSEEEMNYIDYHSLMAIPMVQSGLMKGVAIVLHKEPYFFSFDTFKLLQSLIHHSTLAFSNSMLREELENLVITDHLTKLYSRGYLDEKVSLSMDSDECGVFILIDIDNFKSINDTYGHQVGDEVIVQVANLIQSSIRDSDIGARWGGEELAIYLPHIQSDIGMTISERIIKKVESQTNPRVTISCGVSYWNSSQDDSLTDLFQRADQALYMAKESGKNQAVYKPYMIQI
ncbi:diguanylate cyclase [Bacillus timonensis]|nr:diguanylate cyclase [Bacillus timonensis]